MYKWQPWEQKKLGNVHHSDGWCLILTGDELEKDIFEYVSATPHPPDFVLSPNEGSPKGNLVSAWNVERLIANESGNFEGATVVAILPHGDRPVLASFIERCYEMSYALAIPRVIFPTTADGRNLPRFNTIRNLQMYLPLVEKGVILLDYSEEEEDETLLPLLKNIKVEWELFLAGPNA